MSEQDIALAEGYLVRVWAGVRSATTAETFDQLSVENDTSASNLIDSLLHTSSVIRGYIHRGAFLVLCSSQLLVTAIEHKERLKPEAYRWEENVVQLCHQSA